MGERFSLSESTLQEWRTTILECENRRRSTGSIVNLVLFLIWFYEYLEAFTINNMNLCSNFKSVKRCAHDLDVFKLFKMRCILVHRSYSISCLEIVEFYNLNQKLILELKPRSGFEVQGSLNKLDLFYVISFQ